MWNVKVQKVGPAPEGQLSLKSMGFQGIMKNAGIWVHVLDLNSLFIKLVDN